ncbi:large conductance mechanosensitive channel protein MscL [Coprothermobacter platensis]|uniref:large conductance mechanosensitive channel protein MscL n=1 Tax=Coprothermobacter platensis TaxID=108819 RepID=UPI000381D85C|nr:large conductance mechanosensitive channel protein MscL [Coprothermobacter platensis]
MLKGFREFLSRGNVVDLAVAVIVGAAFNNVVNSLVKDLFTPLLGLIGGLPDFSNWKLGPVMIGSFINSVISFVVIAGIVYFVIVLPLNSLENRTKQREQKIASPPEPSEEVKLLRQIVELLQKNSGGEQS